MRQHNSAIGLHHPQRRGPAAGTALSVRTEQNTVSMRRACKMESVERVGFLTAWAVITVAGHGSMMTPSPRNSVDRSLPPWKGGKFAPAGTIEPFGCDCSNGTKVRHHCPPLHPHTVIRSALPHGRCNSHRDRQHAEDGTGRMLGVSRSNRAAAKRLVLNSIQCCCCC